MRMNRCFSSAIRYASTCLLEYRRRGQMPKSSALAARCPGTLTSGRDPLAVVSWKTCLPDAGLVSRPSKVPTAAEDWLRMYRRQQMIAGPFDRYLCSRVSINGPLPRVSPPLEYRHIEKRGRREYDQGIRGVARLI